MTEQGPLSPIWPLAANIVDNVDHGHTQINCRPLEQPLPPILIDGNTFDSSRSSSSLGLLALFSMYQCDAIRHNTSMRLAQAPSRLFYE